MLTIGRTTFTVYNPWHGMCPMRLQRWQIRAVTKLRDRAESDACAADRGI